MVFKGSTFFPDWRTLNTSLPIGMAGLRCNGTESALGQCSFYQPLCDHLEDVWLDCDPPAPPPIWPWTVGGDGGLSGGDRSRLRHRLLGQLV